MVKHSSINTLIELASKESDEAAKKLGVAIRFSQDSEQKLTLLQDYREEYATRFQSDLSKGLSAMGYRNFQFFLEKLDNAITGQQEVIADAKRRVVAEREKWQASERKRMSYGRLASHPLKEPQRREIRG